MIDWAAPEIPGYLSGLTEKRTLYAVDTYFREAFEDLTMLSEKSVKRFCHDHTLLLFKPDAVVARKLWSSLDWVAARGFSIVGATTVAMNRHAIRALWHYGFNAASRDRRDAADLYITAADCLLLLLSMADREASATLHLSRAKGPAHPAACRPGQLRYELGSLNYQLNFVHAPDEPADLVRELAVLCDHPTRARLYQQACAEYDATQEAHDLARSLESAYPRENLELNGVFARIEGCVLESQRAVPTELLSLIATVRRGHSRDWRYLLESLVEYEIPVTLWQRIVLATSLLNPYEPGRESLLPDASTGPTTASMQDPPQTGIR